jgi:PleD family two-component response regulator
MANDGETFTQVLSRADKALYRAKDGGRDQVQLAEVV